MSQQQDQKLRKRNVSFSDKSKENDIDDDNGVPTSKSFIREKNKNDDGRNSSTDRYDNDRDDHRIMSNVPPNKASSIDRLLQAYAKFTTNAFNQDKILKLMQYSLWMLSQFYQPNHEKRKSLQHLSGQVSWARYVTRFLGFPTAVQEVLYGNWENPKMIGRAMAWSMLFYYPMEHISYLKWQKPSLIFPKSSSEHRIAERAAAWSCRFWLSYIVLDVIRSTLALRKKDSSNGNPTSPSALRNERLQLIRSALFAFPALNWSLPNWDTDPWLSDILVNSLMFLESVVCMYQGIANFQGSS